MNNIKKMIRYYKPYKGMFAADMFFAFLSSAITLVIPLIARYILYDVVNFDKSRADYILVRLAFLTLFLLIIEFFCNYFMGFYGHMVGAHMEYDMRSEIFSHYQKLSFTFFDNQKVGQLLSRVTSDLFDICELLHHGPEDLLISIVKLLGTSIILIFINTKLALITLIFIPIMCVVAIYFNSKMKKAFKRNRDKIAEVNETIEDSLSGIRVVKSFANEDVEKEKFRKGNQSFVDAKKISYKYFASYNSLLTFFVSLLTVVVVFVGSYLIFHDSMNKTDLITFFLYLANLTDPIKKLIAFTESFQNGYAGFTRFNEILSITPDIKDKENAISIDKLDGNINYNNVSFLYENDSERVLNNINLEVNAGDYIAIVGESGVGKTTLLSLLPRFYDVDSGSITIDGYDIRDLKLDDLRRQIGIVQQDVYLFAGTIFENIKYGNMDATYNDVINAAKLANAHEFITSFEDGYDTNIGQRGVKLSGGQKQRLSIARVFLKNPPILILDEATSSLDNKSEKIIQNSLEELSKGRTTFVIAHRLSTIHNAQKIVVLTNNGIVEIGNHEELIKKDGVYKKLYDLQFRYGETND